MGCWGVGLVGARCRALSSQAMDSSRVDGRVGLDLFLPGDVHGRTYVQYVHWSRFAVASGAADDREPWLRDSLSCLLVL